MTTAPWDQVGGVEDVEVWGGGGQGKVVGDGTPAQEGRAQLNHVRGGWLAESSATCEEEIGYRLPVVRLARALCPALVHARPLPAAAEGGLA